MLGASMTTPRSRLVRTRAHLRIGSRARLRIGSRARLASALLLVAAAGALVATGCGSLKDASSGSPTPPVGDDGDGGSGGDGAGGDDGGPNDAHASGDGASVTDGATVTDGAVTEAGTGLDPGVPIPPLGNEPCNPPGNETVCPGTAACRMATPDSGRCEDCSANGTCSKLIGTSCVGSNDCDINLNCFRGSCTLVCPMAFPQVCGGTRKCLDVGYTGGYGLCEPTF